MNIHDCLLIFNNRGHVSVSALEDFQLRWLFLPFTTELSVVSYKVGRGREAP